MVCWCRLLISQLTSHWTIRIEALQPKISRTLQESATLRSHTNSVRTLKGRKSGSLSLAIPNHLLTEQLCPPITRICQMIHSFSLNHLTLLLCSLPSGIVDLGLPQEKNSKNRFLSSRFTTITKNSVDRAKISPPEGCWSRIYNITIPRSQISTTTLSLAWTSWIFTPWLK